MAILPWRRRRERAERAQLEDLNRLMSYGGAVGFVEGPPDPDSVCPAWEHYGLYDPKMYGWSYVREMGISTGGALWRTVGLLGRCGRSMRVARWGGPVCGGVPTCELCGGDGVLFRG